ncbi:hypothetical protein PUNSTDRAFT_57446 [Punctularia strigosozonata HHB-11173 SS5]|uniref:uncharacterized protein n=1 Tax=Punctularia strigosozonata (strain HHB-11173) TaxID=741275 RepID=UPI000441650A|nr:uncharacterized protein PUNSTDRAFT_57446 [Punctularia strigosozonata HHB-11173 SS5]EIN14052.1 hypothetical protein PUNSTDRAFT_57446 [Punctularia strigosozonata HHB-11173 SS5]
MAPIFQRFNQAICFFCNETQTPSPRNCRQFRCAQCGCWNRYDAAGEIMSDEPAMHDASLNAKSFAKRASPRKDRLPTMDAHARKAQLFCHTCQTNQMLIINLLSNYLPEPADPSYSQRLSMLPKYKESLHTRYPPVCAQCAPLVDDVISQREHMARTNALGGWLKNTKGKEAQRRQPSSSTLHEDRQRKPSKDRFKLEQELWMWRARGCLWCATLLGSVAGHVWGIELPPPWTRPFCAFFPLYIVVSVLWTFWDPTYSSVQKARWQGRQVWVRGRARYIVYQLLAWLSRLMTAVLFALPLYAPDRDYLRLLSGATGAPAGHAALTPVSSQTLLASFLTLRLHYPPKVRLIDTNPSRRSVAPETRVDTPSPPEPGIDLLAPLSFSGNPVLQTHEDTSVGHPIFGLPSLTIEAHKDSDGRQPTSNTDPNAMDIDTPSPVKPRSPFHPDQRDDTDNSVWLRPQRFFPPEKPTGLEGLLERTLLIDPSVGESGDSVRPGEAARRRKMLYGLAWGAALLSMGVATHLWHVGTTRSRTAMDLQIQDMEIATSGDS